MKLDRLRERWLLQEDLNFLLTNRIPRRTLTLLMGWYSRIESRWLTRLSIAVWRLFTELDLREARQTQFQSLHACFTRELREGARPVQADPQILVSPCDGIVGECGPVGDGQIFQAKGFPYRVADLFGSEAAAEPWRGGRYVTLRLTSSMYHRFHAPHDGRLQRVTYISGDTWNVNPIALRRVERLFCRNERAVLDLQLDSGHRLALVPVAAILVASIRLHALDVRLHLRWPGPNVMEADHPFRKGQELGWFEHGSTIIVFAPAGFELAPAVRSGHRVRMGEGLMIVP
ncbi:MAG: phosphatidylserine decarboxylase [Rubrivivax sp.]|nr:phosphatidylserine decarboxylase [Rubrivivax sp.]